MVKTITVISRQNYGDELVFCKGFCLGGGEVTFKNFLGEVSFWEELEIFDSVMGRSVICDFLWIQKYHDVQFESWLA